MFPFQMANSDLKIKEEKIDDLEEPKLSENDKKKEPFDQEDLKNQLDYDNFMPDFEICEFVNENFCSTIENYKELYFMKKSPDCVLYSEEGTKFEIHRELLGSTPFLRNILHSAQGKAF